MFRNQQFHTYLKEYETEAGTDGATEPAPLRTEAVTPRRELTGDDGSTPTRTLADDDSTSSTIFFNSAQYVANSLTDKSKHMQRQ